HSRRKAARLISIGVELSPPPGPVEKKWRRPYPLRPRLRLWVMRQPFEPLASFDRRKLLAGLAHVAAGTWLASCAGQPHKSENPTMNTPQSVAVKSGQAPVNGISMYYEIHGDVGGTPLVLLHGGGSSIDVTYGRVLPFLAQRRRVIALDEQAHGRTTDPHKPVRFDTAAAPVAAPLPPLAIRQTRLIGL